MLVMLTPVAAAAVVTARLRNGIWQQQQVSADDVEAGQKRCHDIFRFRSEHGNTLKLYFLIGTNHRTSQIDKFKSASTNILRELGRFVFSKSPFG